MIDVEFTVPGTPIAQPRQQFRVAWPSLASFPWSKSPKDFLAWLKAKTFVQNFVPSSHPVTTYKQAIALVARTHRPGHTIEGPFRLWITFVMPRPANITRKTKPNPREWHDKKPDLDNLAKAVKDAITAGGLWDDDRQVVWTCTQKIIASGDEQPRTIIRVCSCDPIATTASGNLFQGEHPNG